MAKAKPNADGYFRSTFYFKGKQYVCTSKTSQKEADKKAAIKLDKMERGEVGISSKMTVERWAREWMEVYRKPFVIDAVYDAYLRLLETYVFPSIGNIRLIDVKDIMLQKIPNSMTGKSKSTLKKTIMLLKGMFKQARISQLIPLDPAESLQVPEAPEGKRRSITDFEREHILKTADVHYGGAMIKILLYCGLRPGEARALTWPNVDFEKKYIYVRQAFESGNQNLKPPKTKAGIRDVPIPDILIPTLNELYLKSENKMGFVFLQKRGNCAHTESSIRKLWSSFKNAVDDSMGAQYEKVEAADGKMRKKKILSIVSDDLVLYCLRHTYCTDLETAGVPINIAKYLMGHSDIAVTSKIYTHTGEAAIENARNLINENKKEA